MTRVDSGLPKIQQAGTRPVVLASGSATRAAMLTAAGIPAEAVPPAIDEGGIKASLVGQGSDAADVARALAELKAVRISHGRPGALVIGADQVLVCNGVLFDKPADRDHARGALQALRGRMHELVSVAAVALDGTVIWHETGHARLWMRRFSDDFLDDYLERMGDGAMSSVGGYQLEGLGAQLFARVEGDLFTILGLPLLPLLDFLRGHGVVKP